MVYCPRFILSNRSREISKAILGHISCFGNGMVKFLTKLDG